MFLLDLPGDIIPIMSVLGVKKDYAGKTKMTWLYDAPTEGTETNSVIVPLWDFRAYDYCIVVPRHEADARKWIAPSAAPLQAPPEQPKVYARTPAPLFPPFKASKTADPERENRVYIIELIVKLIAEDDATKNPRKGAAGTAPWEDVVEHAAKKHQMTEEQVEDALNELMERGRIFEPVLGRLKPT